MSPKKTTWKSFFLGCLKNPTQLSKPKIHASNHQLNSQRISLSEINNTPGSPLSVSDLSNSIFNLHVFSLKEMEMVTHKFSKSNYLGEGGFGSVFKGFIGQNLRPGLGAQPVAVKVLDLDGSQGHREWLAEVIFLGQLKHPHLVNLIGYCCEDEHRLLVYEYMERGNLETQLFKRYSGVLPWLTRLKIALGAAKGLTFLHEEQKPVIYRDFKASNVLLDADFNAKLSDFGLATDGPQGDESHITTRVMGTEGYAAPEYIMTGHLTTQSDVFSFGVVLLELITGRRSVDKNRPSREQNLVKWAKPMLKDTHKLHQILMDPTLEGQYSHEGAKKAATLAYQCLSYHCKSRPTMANVVKTLESILQFNDIPSGNFVYVFPSSTENDQNQNQEAKEPNLNPNPNPNPNSNRKPKGRRHRKRVKSMSSRAVFSDTTLYKTLGTDLYKVV